MHRPASILRQLFILAVALAALFFAAARPARADEKPPAAGGFYGTFEGHYLENIGEKTRWGTLTDSSFNPIANLNVLSKWGGGGRVGLGYHAAAGWDVVALGDADWLYSGHQQVLVTGSQSIFDTLAPVAFPIGVAQFGADAQTAYSYVDLEGGYNLKPATTFDARIFGGVRYANFDQDIETSGSRLPLFPFQLDTRREVTYWGVGPRLGASGRLRICESPFYVVSSVSGSVLFGDMKVQDQSSLSFGTSINNIVLRNKMYTARTAYNGEGELGVLYDISPILQGLDVTVGYRLSGWFGVNDTRSATTMAIFASPGTSGESHANVVTQGIFLRLNVRY